MEHFARLENGQWVIAATLSQLEESLDLASIDCTLKPVEIYDRIIFPKEDSDLHNLQ